MNAVIAVIAVGALFGITSSCRCEKGRYECQGRAISIYDVKNPCATMTSARFVTNSASLCALCDALPAYGEVPIFVRTSQCPCLQACCSYISGCGCQEKPRRHKTAADVAEAAYHIKTIVICVVFIILAAVGTVLAVYAMIRRAQRQTYRQLNDSLLPLNRTNTEFPANQELEAVPAELIMPPIFESTPRRAPAIKEEPAE